MFGIISGALRETETRYKKADNAKKLSPARMVSRFSETS